MLSFFKVFIYSGCFNYIFCQPGGHCHLACSSCGSDAKVVFLFGIKVKKKKLADKSFL